MEATANDRPACISAPHADTTGPCLALPVLGSPGDRVTRPLCPAFVGKAAFNHGHQRNPFLRAESSGVLVSAMQPRVPPAAPVASLLGYCPIPPHFLWAALVLSCGIIGKSSVLFGIVFVTPVFMCQTQENEWKDLSLFLIFRTFWACASR